jgi:glucan phosphoethanolaminetransferase (alkaline phosphatase superfamily)
MWWIIPVAVGAYAAYQAHQEAKKQNKLIDQMKTSLSNQAVTNRELYLKRQQQLRKQQDIARTERLIQMYKQIGAQTAWAAAQGLQGGGATRLNLVEKADAEKDLRIIEENLENYLLQLNIEQNAFQTDVTNRLLQLEAQKIDPFNNALRTFLNTVGSTLQIGSRLL